MTTATLSATRQQAIAYRAVALHDVLLNTDQHKLKRQLWRSGLTCVGSLIGAVGLSLFIVFGRELDERAAVFVAFLLVVCACLFVVSVFAFITPMLDVFAFQRILAIQKEIECCELTEQNQMLTRTLREAANASDQQEVDESFLHIA